MEIKLTRNETLKTILRNIWDEYTLYKKDELDYNNYEIAKEKILLLKYIGNMMLGKNGRLYKEISNTEKVIVEKR